MRECWIRCLNTIESTLKRRFLRESDKNWNLMMVWRVPALKTRQETRFAASRQPQAQRLVMIEIIVLALKGPNV